MKVENITNNRGNKVPNQFIVEDCTIKHTTPNGTECFYTGIMFQSYNSNIAFKTNGSVLLDERYWDYSVTTSKHRNIFLGETTKETKAKIKSGEYKLTNLN